jgi:uncharacterized protein (TIGR03437 family)
MAYQQTLYSTHKLAAGLHRLTIEVLNLPGATLQGTWIWVNGFSIDNGSLVGGGAIAAGPGLTLQTNAAVNYSGQWFQLPGQQYAGGAINMANASGARVDFTFAGTAVTWIGYGDQWSGTAEVLLDGVLQATVDTYQIVAQDQSSLYTLTGLPAGTHVVSIVATGAHDEASGGSNIWVNGFQVALGGTGTAPAPEITGGGVVNAASFASAPNNSVAPGQIVSIFGQNFIAAGSASANRLPLPRELGPQNTTVTACGAAFPLYNVFLGQINAQIPLECPTGGNVTVTVSVGGQVGTQTFTLAPASPGIFTVNGSGGGDGVIVDTNGTLISPGNPAGAGNYVVIYATGLGATNVQFGDGMPASQMNNTTLPVTVTIGGKPATVTYAGLTQDFVGLYQVNAIVPSGLTGSQQVIVTVGGTYSSPAGVTMSVQE